MDEGSIVLDYTSIPGTSLEETNKELQQVEKIINSTPEVSAYSRRTGTQMGFFITEPNDGDYLIQLKKNRKRTSDEVINDIRMKIEASQPVLKIDFGQVMGDMLSDLSSNLTDAVNDGLSDTINGVVERVVDQVGLEDFYYL